jgi:hypothetical protein
MKLQSVRLEVVTAVLLKIQFFWDVTLSIGVQYMNLLTVFYFATVNKDWNQ